MTWLTPWNIKGAKLLGAEDTFSMLPRLATKLSCFRSELFFKVLEHLNGSFGHLNSSNMSSNIYDSKEVLWR